MCNVKKCKQKLVFQVIVGIFCFVILADAQEVNSESSVSETKKILIGQNTIKPNKPVGTSDPEENKIYKDKVTPEKVVPVSVKEDKIYEDKATPEEVVPVSLEEDKIYEDKVTPEEVVPVSVKEDKIYEDKATPEEVVPVSVEENKIYKDKVPPEEVVPVSVEEDKIYKDANNPDDISTSKIVSSPQSLPDLEPYARSGWDNKIVLSTSTGTTTTSSTIYNDQTIYVDYSCINTGDANAGAFKLGFYIDGTLKQYASLASLAAGYHGYILDSNIGTLSAGTHTFMIKADYENSVSESDETNNTYSRTFTITARTTGKPDLEPYARSGWDNKIVLSTSTGTTTTSSTIYNDQTIYVDYSCINTGDADAGAFKLGFYIDGTLKQYASLASLAAGYHGYILDSNIGTLSAGTHTFMIKADYENSVSESDETNNTYSRTFTITARTTGKPDLEPYARSGWDNKIVLSTSTGTTTTSSTIYNDQTIYVDYSCINTGDADAGAFKLGFYIDGTLKQYASLASLAAGYHGYVLDSNIGTLSAGTHTFMIKADYENSVSESDENNNTYSRTFTITARTTGKPDLEPYARSGWDDKIVLSTTTGTTTTSSTIYSDQTIYVDFSCINTGDADAGAFKLGLYIDGTLKQYASLASLAAGYHGYVLDSNIGTLSAGTHTFMIKADYENSVSESDENNNTYSRTFTITARTTGKPDLEPYARSGWDDKIVLSTTTGTTTTSSTIYDDQTIYVDFSCVNTGDADAGAFKLGFYIDGTLKKYASLASLAAGYHGYVLDSNIGTLSAGTHTFMIKADYENSVSESDENNNTYSRTFTITARTTGPDINVNPLSITIRERKSNSSNNYLTDYHNQINEYTTGLIIPEHIKQYWITHEPKAKGYKTINLKSSIDWSVNDSPVKSQGSCGSCWAFSTIGLIENLSGLSDLSEQVIVSCVPPESNMNNNCSGGWYGYALKYIHSDGVPEENCYTYLAENGDCSDKCDNPGLLVTVDEYDEFGNWGVPTSSTVNDLKSLLQNGPVLVSMRGTE